MKTFKDLQFNEHSLQGEFAFLEFDNGCGVSVVTGNMFYSNGTHVDYELAMVNTITGDLQYHEITNHDVLGYLSKEEVTEVMEKIQSLKSPSSQLITEGS